MQNESMKMISETELRENCMLLNVFLLTPYLIIKGDAIFGRCQKSQKLKFAEQNDYTPTLGD